MVGGSVAKASPDGRGQEDNKPVAEVTESGGRTGRPDAAERRGHSAAAGRAEARRAALRVAAHGGAAFVSFSSSLFPAASPGAKAQDLVGKKRKNRERKPSQPFSVRSPAFAAGAVTLGLRAADRPMRAGSWDVTPTGRTGRLRPLARLGSSFCEFKENPVPAL